MQPEQGKLRFSYSGSVNVEAPDLTSYNMMNAREKLEYEWATGLYETDRGDEEQGLLELFNYRWTEMARGVDTYWMKYPIRTTAGHSHTLRIDGGKDEIRYGVNFSWRKTAGVLKGSDRNALTGGMTLQYNMKKLLFRNDLKISYSKGDNSPYGSFGDWTVINSYYTPYDDEGNLKKILENSRSHSSLGGSRRDSEIVYNPLYDAL